MANLVTDTTFDAEVLAASEPVLVDFWAEWCPPCKAMDPILDDLSRELAGKVKIVKLNVEENVGIVTRYNVRAMPTMIVFKNGEPVDVIPARASAPTQRLPAVRTFEYGTMTGTSTPPQLRDVNVPGPATEASGPVAR